MFRILASGYSRRAAAVLAAIAMLAGIAGHAMAEGAAFTPAALEAAQSQGKSIVVHISAPWCPVCKAQKPILDGLAAKDAFKGYVFLDVDFDSQKDALRSLKVQSQSTLVVYKGGKEVGRSAGDTDAASIEALLANAK